MCWYQHHLTKTHIFCCPCATVEDVWQESLSDYSSEIAKTHAQRLLMFLVWKLSLGLLKMPVPHLSLNITMIYTRQFDNRGLWDGIHSLMGKSLPFGSWHNNNFLSWDITPFVAPVEWAIGLHRLPTSFSITFKHPLGDWLTQAGTLFFETLVTFYPSWEGTI